MKNMDGWHPRVQLLRESLEAMIEASQGYKKEMIQVVEKYSFQPNSEKVIAVLNWQIGITDELIETLETVVTEEVIRIAEQDAILSDSDVYDILI